MSNFFNDHLQQITKITTTTSIRDQIGFPQITNSNNAIKLYSYSIFPFALQIEEHNTARIQLFSE